MSQYAKSTASTYELPHLDALEAESAHIFREVAATFERPVLLFSGGKDSVVMLHLAAKAFWPAPLPFPVLHIDTGHNFDEVIAYRDETVTRLGLRPPRDRAAGRRGGGDRGRGGLRQDPVLRGDPGGALRGLDGEHGRF
uniref:phosphoadenosine phosphosulfate reductase domain-containing protein n=1 Tax=Nocardia brasiliensis TaxID=37326 RepID=UPI002456F2E5